MELIDIFKSIWIIAGILFGILIIGALVKAFIEEVVLESIKATKKEKAFLNILDKIAETEEEYQKSNKSTKESKK